MHERYDCPEVRSVWSEENKYREWMNVELTFLRHFRGTKVELPEKFVWVDEVKRIEQKTRHDTAAFVEWLEGWLNRKIGDESRFVHFGLTSSDVVDTAFSLCVQQTDKILNAMACKAIYALHELKEKYGALQMVGRTHGQAAEAILLSDKLSAYQNALEFNSPLQVEHYGRLCGSVGDYKYFPKSVSESAVKDLGLIPCPVVDGQVIHRSVYADHMNRWAVLGSCVAKIATDIRLLAQTEVGEFAEPFGEGQVGSSSMPQKRNPILCENLCGLARVLRGYQSAAMENIELWNERDISNSSAERIIFPDAAVLLGFMLGRLTRVLEGLVVNKPRIIANVEGQLSAMRSQGEMLRLIRSGMSRAEAHAKLRTKS